MLVAISAAAAYPGPVRCGPLLLPVRVRGLVEAAGGRLWARLRHLLRASAAVLGLPRVAAAARLRRSSVQEHQVAAALGSGRVLAMGSGPCSPYGDGGRIAPTGYPLAPLLQTPDSQICGCRLPAVVRGRRVAMTLVRSGGVARYLESRALLYRLRSLSSASGVVPECHR